MSEEIDRSEKEVSAIGGQVRSGSVEAVVDMIVENCRSGLYVSGQRLSEPDLTKRFGVGRGTVREALRRLAGEGVVSITRYQGAFIRALSKSEMLDTYKLLEVLYGLAARQAAERLSHPEEAAEFRACLDALLSLEGTSDFFASIKAREQFFDLICRISRNKELQRVQPKLIQLIVRIQLRHAMAENVRFRDYRMIGEAILNGDAELAEFAARRHLQHALQEFDTIPESAFPAEHAVGGEHSG